MFDKIIGYNTEKAELARFCDVIANPEYYKSYNINIPKGIILYGEPGVGKTTFANSIVEYTGRPSFVLRKNADTAQFIKNIRKTFEEAKKVAPSIIILDDMDKFGNGEQYAQEYTALQGAIDDYKAYDIFIIGTANNLYALPSSLYRAGRFDNTIYINNPTGKESNQITSYYLSNKNIAPDVDIDLISKLVNGCSCAALETIANTAALYAAYERSPLIYMRHLLEAILNLIYRLPKTDDHRSPEERYRASIRAAGRAVALYYLRPSTLTIVTIRECSFNKTSTDKSVETVDFRYKWCDDYEEKTFKDYLNEIVIWLASKAAYEIKFNEFDTQTGSDIQMAKETCSTVVSTFGANGINNTFTYDPESDTIVRDNDGINKLLEQGYDYAKYFIGSNWNAVENIAMELMNNDVLLATDIYRIINVSMNSSLPTFNNLIKY